jgi:hypothetical protein
MSYYRAFESQDTSMSLACALSLLPFAADAPRYADDGKVHGCFSRI